MSFSTAQDRLESPVKRKFEVHSSGDGEIAFYDKEEAKNLKVDLPFEFIVLDQLKRVGGFCDEDNRNYWSNEIKNTGKDVLTVRASKAKATGLWANIKDSLPGAKLATVAYIAYKVNNEYLLGKIVLERSGLAAWINFVDANKGVVNAENKVVITGFSEQFKKGTNLYRKPIFTVAPLTDDDTTAGNKLDKELQVYLNQCLNRKPTEGTISTDKGDVILGDDFDETEEIDLDSIPF